MGIAARTLVLVLTLGWGWLEPAAAWQGEVLDANMRVTVDPDSSLTMVAIDYVLRAAPGATDIPIAVLLFAPTHIIELRARSAASDGGTPLPLRVQLDSTNALRFTGSVALPIPLRPGEQFPIVLEYAVDSAVTGTGRSRRVTLPVVAVTWPPLRTTATRQMFVAEISVPEQHGVHDAFPTTLRRAEDRDGRPSYRLELQVVPSLVRFTASAGGVPLVTVPRIVDLGLLMLLGLLGLVGWRHLRPVE